MHHLSRCSAPAARAIKNGISSGRKIRPDSAMSNRNPFAFVPQVSTQPIGMVPPIKSPTIKRKRCSRGDRTPWEKDIAGRRQPNNSTSAARMRNDCVTGLRPPIILGSQSKKREIISSMFNSLVLRPLPSRNRPESMVLAGRIAVAAFRNPQPNFRAGNTGNFNDFGVSPAPCFF
jgi:hypothetical protein